MLSYPSSGGRSLLDWARFYHSQGMAALPVDSRTRCPKRPLVEFSRLKDTLPTWEEVRSLFRSRPSADSLGVVLPPKAMVLDCDGPQGLDWLADRPLPGDGPLSRTRRGFHVWLAAPPGATGKAQLAPEVDLLCAGHFCMVYPSPDKAWERPLAMPLPEPPDWLSAAAQAACSAKAGTRPEDADTVAESLAEQLAAYEAEIPDLTWDDDNKGTACCPFHDDRTPSFSVYMRRGIASRIYWKCHAECEHSFVKVAGGKRRHGGNLNDFRRLLRKLQGTEEYDRARSFLTSLDCSLFARKLIRSVIDVAEERDLGLACKVGLDYRSIAARVGCETVIVKTGRPKGYLSKNGRAVRSVIDEVEDLGVTVIRGEQNSKQNGRGKRTAFALPSDWYQ